MPNSGTRKIANQGHRPTIEALRAEIVEVGRLLFEGGLIAGTDGNISARCGEDRMLITASGLRKGSLDGSQCILVDMQGRPIVEKDSPRDIERAQEPNYKASSEIAMHLEAYRQRPDIGAIVHAHPPHVIALSIAGLRLDAALLPEALIFLGFPPTIPYARPSSVEGALAIREAVLGHDALVLARHGSLTLGASPSDALGKTETLEQLARVACLLAGFPNLAPMTSLALPRERAAELMQLRAELGLGRQADRDDLEARYAS
jgi:L-fuculose-phosphate aldolase